MFTQFSEKAMFSKIMVAMLSIGFLFGSVSMGYANTNALRTKAAAESNAAQEIKGALGGGEVDPLVLSLNVSRVLGGADTGKATILHAALEGANGSILNHSEPRAIFEESLKAILRTMLNLYNKKGFFIDSDEKAYYLDPVKTITNLPEDAIKKTSFEFLQSLNRIEKGDNYEV